MIPKGPYVSWDDFSARASEAEIAGFVRAVGQVARAEQNLQQALRFDPANAAALGALAQLRFDQGQYLDARAFMQRRLVAAPANRDALLLAARIEDRMGDAAAAARYRSQIPETQSPPGNGDPNGARAQ